MRKSISAFMAGVHVSVNTMSAQYLSNDRRYNYTTPKSFLEQIKLYQNLLAMKHSELQANMTRLENGLEKLNSTAQQVTVASTSLLHYYVINISQLHTSKLISNPFWHYFIRTSYFILKLFLSQLYLFIIISNQIQCLL